MSILRAVNPAVEESDVSGKSVTVGVVMGSLFGVDIVISAARSVLPNAEIEVFSSGFDAFTRIAQEAMDLYLVELNLTDMDGIDLIGTIQECWPSSRSMLLVERLTEMACLRLSAGIADGFFDYREERGHTLGPAIARLMDGAAYESRPLREARRRVLDGRTPLERLLSPAETLVFGAIGDGSDDLIASTLLGLSVHTVHSHRRNIMRKLELRSRADLVREAAFRGVVRFGPEGIIRPGFDRGRTRQT